MLIFVKQIKHTRNIKDIQQNLTFSWEEIRKSSFKFEINEPRLANVEYRLSKNSELPGIRVIYIWNITTALK